MRLRFSFRSSIPVVLVSAIALAGISCSKSIQPSEQLSPVTPSAVDANAGEWKMIYLSSATQVPVAPPTAVSNPSYQSELAAIKNAQANLTDTDRASITYWSGGGVLRWNQILRELVAAADLPPAPNPDGSYPSPIRRIPSPIRDIRSAILLTPRAPTATFRSRNIEALKVAWYYKFQYNRPSPCQTATV